MLDAIACVIIQKMVCISSWLAANWKSHTGFQQLIVDSW